MVDPVIVSSTIKPSFIIDLSGQNSNPMIPDWFITKHLKGKIHDVTKLKLTSDASDKAWEVELNGKRLADGWQGFSISHSVRGDEVLSFRHDGDMVFHVTPFGRSFSQIQVISSTSDDDDDGEHNIFDDDHDYDDEEDISDVGDDEISDDDLCLKKSSSSKKRGRTCAEDSSSEKSYVVLRVTPSSKNKNHISLKYKFAKANGLNNRWGEIELKNEHGESWTLCLRHNRTTGQVFINGAWKSFCDGNGIEAGSSCRFKLVENGTKPVLQLCNIFNVSSSSTNKKQNVFVSEGNDEVEHEDRSESALMNGNKILTVEIKHSMLRSSQLFLPKFFAKENGITEEGEITVMNKDGVEYKLHLVKIKGREQFYIKGLKSFFLANGILNLGDYFTVEVIQGGTSPIVKLCLKVKETPQIDGHKTPETMARARATVQEPARAEDDIETPEQKRARVSADGGGPSCGTRASNKSSADPVNLQLKQPLQPCSISDQVIKVRQSIIDTLTCVKLFRSELEIKEQNLEVSLQEIDALGEKIMGIGKFFNINQV